MLESTRKELIKEFGLDPDNIKSNNETTIESCREYMKQNFRYDVALNSRESLSSLFIEKELEIPKNIKVKNFDRILKNVDHYSKNTNNVVVSFENFINLQFISTRGKGNELVDGIKKEDDLKTIAAVIAPIRKAVFLEKEEGLLQPFDEVPLGSSYIYNFDSFSTITHENGNHRLYGCMLFAPYLKNFYVEFESVARYYPNEKFDLEIENLKKIINRLSIFEMNIDITFQEEDFLTPDKNITATLNICSKHNAKYSIYRLFSMSLEDIVKSLNKDTQKVIKRLNEVDKTKNIGIYAHNINEYTFDGGNPNDKYPIVKINNKLTPLSEKIINTVKRIF